MEYFVNRVSGRNRLLVLKIVPKLQLDQMMFLKGA